MKQVPVTNQLKSFFRSFPQTLIMQGYCDNFDDVKVFNDGQSYATVAQISQGYSQICLFTQNCEFADEVLSAVSGKAEFCGVSPTITDYLAGKYTFKWLTQCNLYVWNNQALNTDVVDCPIRPLEEKYADWVSDGTPYKADVDNVRKCIRMHPSAAVYADGKPICWCLLHQEGSLGMLYTLPEFRRQGYALKVMTALTDTVIRRGNVPYAYIIVGNTASEKLAPKYNLRRVCPANYFLIDKGEQS